MPGTGDALFWRGAQRELDANAIGEMAEIGAARLAQYGPQGEQWAEALRRDPRAAVMAADQYGGMGAIEQGLAAAIAQGQAVSARSAMEPNDLVRSFAVAGDGTQAKAVAEALGLIGGAGGQRRIVKGADGFQYYADDGRRVLPGISKPNEEFKPEDRRGIRNDRQKVGSTFEELFQAYKKAKSADVESPEWGQALTIIMNKVLQPNSAVLEGEANATARSLQSMLESMGASVEGIYNPQTPLGREGRLRIMNQIDDLAEVALSDYVSRHEGWRGVNRDLGFDGRMDKFTRPGYERIPDINNELKTIRENKARRSSDPLLDDVKSRDEVTLPDGTVLRRNATGTWDPVP